MTAARTGCTLCARRAQAAGCASSHEQDSICEHFLFFLFYW
jgi:hypothetical protein